MAFLDMNEKVYIELLSRKWGHFFFGKSEQSSLFIKVHFDSETLNSSLAKWDPDIQISFKKFVLIITCSQNWEWWSLLRSILLCQKVTLESVSDQSSFWLSQKLQEYAYTWRKQLSQYTIIHSQQG